MILNQSIQFAGGEAQDLLIKSLSTGRFALKTGEHLLTKSQRYQIIRKVYSSPEIDLAKKTEYLTTEMAIDYSDIDELQKIKCLACLPDDENKASLWKNYIEKTKFSQEQFAYSSSSFFNPDNQEQSLHYADLFFQNIEAVKQKYHRDYGQHFFHNLSPTFLGRPEHLQKFREIQERTEKEGTDTHFLKLLSNEIEKLEEILSFKE